MYRVLERSKSEVNNKKEEKDDVVTKKLLTKSANEERTENS